MTATSGRLDDMDTTRYGQPITNSSENTRRTQGRDKGEPQRTPKNTRGKRGGERTENGTNKEPQLLQKGQEPRYK